MRAAQIWDMDSPIMLGSFTIPELAHNCILRFSRSGNFMAVSTSDRAIKVRGHDATLRTMKQYAEPCRAFAVLVALTGCDFSQSMPAIGPAKMWTAHSLMHKLDLASEHGILSAITLTYQLNFSKSIHTIPYTQIRDTADIDTSKAAYECVADAITKNTSIAQKTKNAMWSSKDATRHARNVLWTLEYWSTLERWPDPMQAKFGFAVDAAGHCSFL